MDTFVFFTSITTAKIEDAPELISPDEHAHFQCKTISKTKGIKTNACSQTHKAYAPDISLYIVQLL